MNGSGIVPAKRYLSRTSRVKVDKVSVRLNRGVGGFGINFGPRPRSCFVPGGMSEVVQRLWKVRLVGEWKSHGQSSPLEGEQGSSGPQVRQPDFQYLAPDLTPIEQKDHLRDLGVEISNNLNFATNELKKKRNSN